MLAPDRDGWAAAGESSHVAPTTMDDVNLKELFKEETRRYILGVINVVLGKLYGAGEET